MATAAEVRRTWRIDAILLALGAVVLRLPALFASAHLTFDDGVYGATVLALRDGGRPYTEVFSSQGPLHTPLLYLFDLVGLRTLDGPRLLTVAAGAVVTVAAYAIGRRITTRRGAILAAALVATSGSMLFVTGPISGDGPALAFATTAVALALAYRAEPSRAGAVAVGAAMGAALCVKLLVLPVALPVGVLLLSRRRVRDLVLAVGIAVGVFLATALPWGLDNVWEQSIAYHQDSPRTDSYGGNFVRLVRTLAWRDPFVVLALLAPIAVLAWYAWRPRRSTRGAPPMASAMPVRLEIALLGTWATAQAVLLVIEPQMWRPHVSHMIVPLALLAALRPASWQILAIGAIALAPWYVTNVDTMLWPSGYPRAEAAVVARLERLPEDVVVITDEPGLAWRAERRPPDQLVDTSIKRIQVGQLTATSVARAASARDVCAVVVWSDERFGSLRGLRASLAEHGYRVEARYGGAKVLYKRDCRA